MMTVEMPSPLGHALAGLTIGLIAERADPAPHRPGPLSGRWLGVPVLAIASMAAATSPDLDLIYPPWHRAITPSIGATAFLMIVTAVVTGKVTGRIDWRGTWTIGAAHASHLLLDWLGTDRLSPAGIQALWPFSPHYYLSGWDIFPPVE